jgi:hypothetical protein
MPTIKQYETRVHDDLLSAADLRAKADRCAVAGKRRDAELHRFSAENMERSAARHQALLDRLRMEQEETV